MLRTCVGMATIRWCLLLVNDKSFVLISQGMIKAALTTVTCPQR